MNYEDYIEQGLNGEAPLKLILRGSIQNSGNEKVGVVSVAYATLDKKLPQGEANFSRSNESNLHPITLPFHRSG